MKSKLFILLVLVLGIACNNTTTVVPASVQLEKDRATIEEYLAANNITAVEDSVSGVQYVIKELGTGVKPLITDCITVKYKGMLLSDGTTFDENATGYKYPLRGFIPGWQIAFPSFPVGTKATIYVPSYYGYGASGSGTIPANSILVFDVELVQVYSYNSTGQYCYDTPVLPEAEQNAIDAGIITDYLTQNNITAQTDPSGLRYTVQTLGTGAMPSVTSCVRVSYTGKLLSGTIFDQSTNYKEALKYLIKGWQVGLPLFPKGSKVTLYVPSRMAYGTQSVGNRVPANSNLIFDIEILDVTDYNAATNVCN